MAANLLSFISDDKLVSEVKKVLEAADSAEKKAEKNFFSNAIDPFSAVFDSMRQGITLVDWVEQEKGRQVQKTLQNAVGVFHQRIVGSMPGWEDLSTGKVVDVKNVSKKIIAEIKNKHNTTKGSDKVGLYDNFVHELSKSEYNGFTAYYVEIIPRNRKHYNNSFIPSDHLARVRRQADERIRIIDGKSFYDIATGEKDSLRKLYSAMPLIISQIKGSPASRILDDKLFHELFDLTY